MTTLAADLSIDADTLRVDAAVADPAPYYQIGSEVVGVRAAETTVSDGTSPNRTRDRTLWQITRAVASTTAATHSAGATLTPIYDQLGTPALDTGGGGGGVTVDNQVDPPFPATTIIAPGATESAPEEATMSGVVVSDTDPGAIGAGHVWINPTGGLGVEWRYRNATNTDWAPVFLVLDPSTGIWLTSDPTGDPSAQIILAPDGSAITITVGDAEVALAADGSITLSAINANNTLTLAVDGTYEINGAQWLQATADGFKFHRPTADPMVAGVDWDDGGVVKVSAG